MENKKTTMKISVKFRNKLMALKYKLGCEDLEEVVKKIYDIATKVEPKLK